MSDLGSPPPPQPESDRSTLVPATLAVVLVLALSCTALSFVKPFIPWYRDIPSDPAGLDMMATLAVLSGGLTPLSAALWAWCARMNRSPTFRRHGIQVPLGVFAAGTLGLGSLSLTGAILVNRMVASGSLF